MCAYNAGDLGSIPGSGRSPGEGNGNPLQYSCLQNTTDGGAWLAIVHRAANSQTRLSDFTSTLRLLTSSAQQTLRSLSHIPHLSMPPKHSPKQEAGQMKKHSTVKAEMPTTVQVARFPSRPSDPVPQVHRGQKDERSAVKEQNETNFPLPQSLTGNTDFLSFVDVDALRSRVSVSPREAG